MWTDERRFDMPVGTRKEVHLDPHYGGSKPTTYRRASKEQERMWCGKQREIPE